MLTAYVQSHLLLGLDKTLDRSIADSTDSTELTHASTRENKKSPRPRGLRGVLEHGRVLFGWKVCLVHAQREGKGKLGNRPFSIPHPVEHNCVSPPSESFHGNDPWYQRAFGVASYPKTSESSKSQLAG